MTTAHQNTPLHTKGHGVSVPKGAFHLPLGSNGGVPQYETNHRFPIIAGQSTSSTIDKCFNRATVLRKATTNILVNPNFVKTVGGNSPDDWAEYFKKGSQTSVILRSYPLDSNRGIAGVKIQSGVTDEQTDLRQTRPAVGGKKYTLSAYAQGMLEGSAEAFLIMMYYNASLTFLGSTEIPINKNTLSTGRFNRFEVSGTSSADTAHIQVCLGMRTSPSLSGYGFVEFMLPQLEQSPFATPYVVGTFSPHDNLEWNISRAGLKDSGCISLWTQISPTMYNGGGAPIENQFIFRLGSDINEPYSDSIGLAILGENTTEATRKFGIIRFSNNVSPGESIFATSTMRDLGLNSWVHVVVQWNKARTPSGNQVELFINGELQSTMNTVGVPLPSKGLWILRLGSWTPIYGHVFTRVEDLMISRSTYSAEVIKQWYLNAPFIDALDMF